MIALAIQFKFPIQLFIVIALSTSVTFASSSEAPEDYKPRDTVFNEILLNEEGVTAVDTAGHEWYYDFELSSFVPGYAPLPESDFEYGGAFGVPVEERAIIQKRVKHFEMGSVTVRPDEYVDGDIKALDMVTVKGWVKGDVISVSDRVFVTETGRVDGNVQAPKVIRKEGGVVLGEIIETKVPIEIKDITSSFSHEFLMVMIVITLSFMFLGFIILAVMPKQVGNIQSCIMQNKARCFILGFLIVLVLPALIVLLAITIVGTVLIPVLPLVYFWSILLGIVATGKSISEFVQRKFTRAKFNNILLGVIGIAILMSPWIITGGFLGSADDTSIGFGVFFLIISIIISLFPIFTGLGATFLTRFGFRSYVEGSPFGPKFSRSATSSPAPPPIPDTPFVQKPETPDNDSRISE